MPKRLLSFLWSRRRRVRGIPAIWDRPGGEDPFRFAPEPAAPGPERSASPPPDDGSGAIEVFWRFQGPSGTYLTCRLHNRPPGLEVRCTYGETVLLSRLVERRDLAIAVAEEWRLIVRGIEQFNRLES